MQKNYGLSQLLDDFVEGSINETNSNESNNNSNKDNNNNIITEEKPLNSDIEEVPNEPLIPAEDEITCVKPIEIK